MEDILSIYTINHKEELELLKFNLHKVNDKQCKNLGKNTRLITYLSNDRIIFWNSEMKNLYVKNVSSNTEYMIASSNNFPININLKFITLGYLPCMTQVIYIIDHDGTIYHSKSRLILNDEVLSKSNKAEFEPIYKTDNITHIYQRDLLWYIFYTKLGETYLDIRSYDFKILVHRKNIYRGSIDGCVLYGTCILFLVENHIYMRQLFDTKNTHLLTLPSTATSICGTIDYLLVSDESSYLINIKDLLQEDSDITITELPICNLYYKSIYFDNDLQWNTYFTNSPYVVCEYISKLHIYPSFLKDIEAHFKNKAYLTYTNICDSSPFKNTHPNNLEIYKKRDVYDSNDLYDMGSIFKAYKRIFHTPHNHINKWKLIQDFTVKDIHNTYDDDNQIEDIHVFEIVASIEGRISAFIYKHPKSGLVHYVPDNNLLAKNINVVNGNNVCLYSSISINGSRDTLWLTQQYVNYIHTTSEY